ncbi:MAG: mechanosensitive ion channel [Saprospiraceae bacterium]|nr:mechanosensitive ion channel [Pyrinomonadaceae bacterium]
MPPSSFQKRAVFFVAFSGIVTLILIAFPLVEGWLQDFVLPQFALQILDGKLLNTDRSEPSMMSSTTVSLVVNIFHIIKIFLWMALIIAVVRFITFLIFQTVLRSSSQSEISSLLKTVLSIIIYIVSFFIIFQSQYPGVQLGALFSGSAILGIVVGLALQDTLGNLFAGIALQADKPFQVGDVVTISNRGSGVIETVSWRGVKIRTFQNKLLVMSNAVMGKETIEVAPRDNLNARIVFFNTVYSSSPSRTIQLVREAVRQTENVSQKLRPIVRILNFGDSGIEWEVKYWADDYTRYNDTDALVRQRIWYVFQRENIHFAYPTRTIHIEPKRAEASLDEYLNTTAELLHAVPIFAPLSDEELDKLAQGSTNRVFAPGEAIVRKGQEGKSMFVIVRGAVDVQIPENGLPKTINRLRDNDFFGEMSLLTGQPRSATVVASEETEVLQIKKTSLKPIFEANPELVESIGQIVEQRRALLTPVLGLETAAVEDMDQGVFSSIRKFFGLK